MKFGFITTEGGTYFQEALEEAVYGESWVSTRSGLRNTTVFATITGRLH
jgi:hypothetical protein